MTATTRTMPMMRIRMSLGKRWSSLCDLSGFERIQGLLCHHVVVGGWNRG